MKLTTSLHWNDYELIDSGDAEKLERFGRMVLRRPEPQALWNRALSPEEWESLWQARFIKEKNNPEKGEWRLRKGVPEQWFIGYTYGPMSLRFRLGLTGFRHIGIFPEQAENWDYIYDAFKGTENRQPKVLNLFAYTGGASLAAAAAGAEVFHVDSVKPVLTWARENMEASGLKGIHWVLEDALKFVQREVRRGSRYAGVFLDPPAYGRGPAGEKWLLEDQINEMVDLCSQLLEKDHGLLMINLYSMGFSPLILENLVSSYFSLPREKEAGELYLPDRSGRKLPLGIYLRFNTL